MSQRAEIDYTDLYMRFHAPIAVLDCGERCAPYNELGVPFCCDTNHAVPAVYDSEWAYLQAHTDLWHLWSPDRVSDFNRLREQTPEGQVLLECLGHERCQRDYRALTCRAFPFFPYITRAGEFIGLSYYWEYEHRCWVISNLSVVTSEYRKQFIDVYDDLLEMMPEEWRNFRHQSILMRRVFGRRRRSIPLLHRNGAAYKITPRNGRMRRVPVEKLPAFGPYKIAAELPFPDEIVSLP